MDEISEAEAAKDRRTKLTSVFIGILAVLLAICAMGGENVATDVTRYNIDATNTWAFFQAKNMRRTAINLAADEIDLKLGTEVSLAEPTKVALKAKVDEYRAQAKKLTTDPERNEGLDELFHKGKAIEAQRDEAMKRDPYFDWSQALLQIAIVLASVSIVAASRPLFWVSGAFGLLGVLLMLDGFTMLVPLPFLT